MPTNKATDINPAQKLSVSAQAVPIIPAQARKSLDCVTRMREALEILRDALKKGSITSKSQIFGTTTTYLKVINEALKEESEK